MVGVKMWRNNPIHDQLIRFGIISFPDVGISRLVAGISIGAGSRDEYSAGTET